MSATEELRRLLDERGVEYEIDDRNGLRETIWCGTTAFQLSPTAKMTMIVTPAQAIAATLGDDGVGRSNDGVSRYSELFGTPERAARTLGRIGYFKPCDEGQTWDCAQCPFDSFDCGGTGTPIDDDYDALLEWLRGDA